MNKKELEQKLRKIEILVQECLADLSVEVADVKKKTARIAVKAATSVIDGNKIDFSVPVRPFVKKYAKDMSGPKKFTLIVAHMSNGNLEKKVDLTEVEKAWNSMTAILGMKFNRFYTQTAKDNDWVISEKKGTYSLRPSWMEIFK